MILNKSICRASFQIILVAALVIGAVSCASAANLLQNPGFEDGGESTQ